MDNINKIYCGDNLEIMRTFPDEFVDLNTGTYGGSPIQVKQSDGVGINVIKNLFATMYDMKIKKGFIVALSFGSGAVEQTAKYKLEDEIEIILIKAEDLCNVQYYDYNTRKISNTSMI